MSFEGLYVAGKVSCEGLYGIGRGEKTGVEMDRGGYKAV
jgi:hypothetical protein